MLRFYENIGQATVLWTQHIMTEDVFVTQMSSNAESQSDELTFHEQ
jgi:hypothetical protein